MKFCQTFPLALMVLALSGCTDRNPPEPQDQAVRPAKIFLVRDQRQLVSYQFVGRVEAAQSVDMTFEVSGPLRQLPVLEGQTVARGQLVAALEDTDFELAVAEAQAELQLARQDLERKQQVLTQRGIARSVVEDARTTFELQQVRLAQAKASLNDARLHAPFDAYVAQRYVDNFVNVAAGQKIVRLNDLHRLLVVANVPEILAATASADQLAGIYAVFDFAPQRRFALQLHENRGEADPLAQTYEVSFLMERPEQLNVLPGMTASVVVEMRQSEEIAADVLIPADALVSDPDGNFFVWLYDPETLQVQRRDVETGMPSTHGIPISSGLRDGDMIVATGASQLREGMRVRVLGEPYSAI